MAAYLSGGEREESFAMRRTGKKRCLFVARAL